MSVRDALLRFTARNPGYRDHEPPKRKKQKAPEAKLRLAILHRYRNDPRIVIWPSPSGMFRQGNSPYMVGTPGQGDLTGILAGGRFVSIECKSPVGRQRETQRHFQAMVERRGGLYIVAKSVDDVERALVG